MKNAILIFIRTILLVTALIIILSLKVIAQDSQIDSLKLILDTTKKDTLKVNILNDLAFNVHRSNPDEAIKYGSEAKDLSEQLNFQRGLAYALKNIGLGYYIKGNFVEATINWEQSLYIFDSLEDDNGFANISGNLGVCYFNMGNESKATEYHLEALKIAEIKNDSTRMATCLLNLGAVLSLKSENSEIALKYFTDAFKIGQSINYPVLAGICLINIGNIYFETGLKDSALIYFNKSLLFFEDDIDIATSLSFIGKIYSEQGNYKTALEYMNNALEKATNNSSQLEIAQILLKIAYSYIKQGNHRLALENLHRALIIAKEIESHYEIRDAYEGLSLTYANLNDYNNAYKYSILLGSIDKTIYNIKSDDKVRNIMYSFELDKKQNQIELQESKIIAKDAMIKQQKTYRNALGIGLLAVILIIIVVVYAYILKRKDNKKILEQNEKIIQANKELKELNETATIQKDEIISSINYAQRIQSAILPPETYITELLNENFILFKPKDIVSGDFYWVKQVKHYILLVAADCTGHGVPGAFMSMLGISYLNEIVQRRGITQANQVLNELRKQIKQSLRQSGQRHESRDGIDMALCVIDTKRNVLQFSGAYNPLYIITTVNGKPELKEFKADTMPIGVHFLKDKPFTNHEIKLEIGDTFYIFSDGYIDQIGGEENKRFSSKRFKKMLLDIHDLAMYEQKEIVSKTLEDWMGENPQRDDILVLGARL